ncbi:hypothetical protein BC938DRAFT_478344 [Jimgerdemannia flammicorona]|uniref:Uncharacterized protein n=1 Tax=Jimgerdemannia flammicorona TaxID=994334 RepID=A0A433QYE8_9FUNG|nr:hypothetical protein BC938DRAFT_478344 [Jimgerdemannia flammicorona]
MAQAIARTLKSTTISVDEKIGAATQAWNSKTVFFPHKDEFLLEWLCTSLLKFVGKNAESPLTETPYLHAAYWALFKDILEHYVSSTKRKFNDRNSHTSSSSFPTIRVPVILAFAAVVERFTNSKSGSADTIQLLETAQACFHYLSTELSASYRPTIEHFSTLIFNILEALEYQYGELNAARRNGDVTGFRWHAHSNAKPEKGAISSHTILWKINRSSLCKYFHSNIEIRNRSCFPQIFTIIISKMFLPFLKVHWIFSQPSAPEYITKNAQSVTTFVANILGHSLFHGEIISEYAVVLQAVGVVEGSVSNKGQTYHHKMLFDQLNELIGGGEGENPRYGMPNFPHAFNLQGHATYNG